MQRSVDWQLFVPAILISLAGLVTMNSFSGEELFFSRQVVWLCVSIGVFFVANAFEWQFISRTKVVTTLFFVMLGVLTLLFGLGIVSNGARSWFDLGGFNIQPSDPAKIVLIIVLAKYFSRRHIEIANLRHIVVSGVYAGLITLLVLLQPDFGSAVILFGIWFALVLVSGISKKHLLAVSGIGLVTIAFMWIFVFENYQKARILTFLSPLSDIQGAGYNAYQSTIAVGSGEIMGKGIGLGSQSKLLFLPEYQTDFIFAAFAEEWGFIGAILLLFFASLLVLRMVDIARKASTNFETLFTLGVVAMIGIHIFIHTGMNIGLLPVTGIVFPFMSYGGSHLLTEWFALGILSSMSRRAQGARLSDRG